ncbi:MAG: PD-(D/E)XK nuclease family protein [Elusimicrobia bacterium]|nr:PD-(D/E)XK nuclease family protein [Elusimicrobiota bacterium]
MELSYSGLKAYRNCGWLYQLLYVEGRRAPWSLSSALGVSVHQALKEYHAGGPADLDRLLGLLDRHWASPRDTSPREQWESYERGVRMLKNYWRMDRDRKTQVVFVERAFEFFLGRYRVRGTIDRVDRWPDGSYELIDYKTHRGRWSRERVAQDTQIVLYAMALRRAFGIHPQRLSLLFLARGLKETIRPDAGREQELETLLCRVGEAIEKKSFSPDLRFCPRCDFRSQCVYSTAREGVAGGFS